MRIEVILDERELDVLYKIASEFERDDLDVIFKNKLTNKEIVDLDLLLQRIYEVYLLRK